jgi:enoyl-CoA hydratase/carnithine racemase
MSDDSILVVRTGHLTTVTINRPERLNALDRAASARLAEVFADFENDREQWVAILTGTGRAFCTGNDLRNMAEGKGPSWDRPGSHGYGFGAITKRFPLTKPVIGAINGLAVAGGLELALVCDILVAADSARFGLTETRWGLMPTGGGTQRLPRRIPQSWANYMILTGSEIDATTAERIGLITHVVPPDQVMATAVALADTICTRAPLAVWAAKEAMARGRDMPLEQALAYEDLIGREVFRSEDAREGPLAFAQKRRPEFKAR